MSESEESEISNIGMRTAGISVSRDTGTKVDLIIRFTFNFFASVDKCNRCKTS